MNAQDFQASNQVIDQEMAEIIAKAVTHARLVVKRPHIGDNPDERARQFVVSLRRQAQVCGKHAQRYVWFLADTKKWEDAGVPTCVSQRLYRWAPDGEFTVTATHVENWCRQAANLLADDVRLQLYEVQLGLNELQNEIEHLTEVTETMQQINHQSEKTLTQLMTLFG